jgi:hypothetical protein
MQVSGATLAMSLLVGPRRRQRIHAVRLPLFTLHHMEIQRSVRDLITVETIVKSCLAASRSHILLFGDIDHRCLPKRLSSIALMAPTVYIPPITIPSPEDVNKVKTLLSEHESPSEKTIQNLLVDAAKDDKLNVVEFLLEQYPTVPIEEEPLRAAVNIGSIPITKALLARDPTIINLPFDRRGSALIVACMGRQRVEYLRVLLEAGADPNMDPDYAAYPVSLVAALYTDDHAAAIDLLLKHGAITKGTGALTCAAQKGKINMVRSFLESGASPEAEDKIYGGMHTGPPALHGAVRGDHDDVVRLLLKYGADPNATDYSGLTAMEIAKQRESDGKDASKVLEALESRG